MGGHIRADSSPRDGRVTFNGGSLAPFRCDTLFMVDVLKIYFNLTGLPQRWAADMGPTTYQQVLPL